VDRPEPEGPEQLGDGVAGAPVIGRKERVNLCPERLRIALDGREQRVERLDDVCIAEDRGDALGRRRATCRGKARVVRRT
jgi:hypothetical protein